MRVALLSPEYPPAAHLGGIGTNTATLAPALAARGHHVVVITDGRQRATAAGADGVEVRRLRRLQVPEVLPGSHVVARLVHRARIALAVARTRPDVVHAAEWEAYAWMVARLLRPPVVTRLATPTHVVDELNHGGPRRDNAAVHWLERDQTQRSAAVYAPTSAIADRVADDWSLQRAAIRLIPNSVDLGAIDAAARSAPGIGLPDRFVVFVGRLERRKGIGELGPALATVLGEHAGLHAVLVGRDPGEAGDELRQAFTAETASVADRVHLLGELPRPQALAVVARAALVVLPSRWESFGYVCLEAMALGRPVVATDQGGFADMIEHGHSGWLVPPGDARALTDAMSAALADDRARAEVGERARWRAADYSVDRVVAQVEQLLLDAARSTASPALDASIYRGGYRRQFRPDEAGPFRRLYQRKRKVVLSALRSGATRQRVADVGGGYGRISGPASDDHDVVLIDLSAEMLAEAGERWSRDLPRVQADARHLPAADGRFDIVVALDLLIHLPDLDSALAELARILKPGGTMLVDSTNAAPWWVPFYPSYVNWRPRRLLETMRHGGVLPEWSALVTHHRAHDVRAALGRAGLTITSVQGFGPPGVAKWHLWELRKR